VILQSQGSRLPFFCVHPLGGSGYYYAQLARQLGNERPFVALHSPALDGLTQPNDRVEDIAAQYVEAIRDIQHSGPYFLGGWSFGAKVAYEMARQLDAGGEAIGLVALFDQGPEASMTSHLDREDDAFILLLSTLHLSDLPSDFSIDHFIRVRREKRMAYLLQQCREAGLSLGALDPSTLKGVVSVWRAHIAAARRYVPQPYRGSVTYFAAKGGINADRHAGPWRRLALGGVTIIPVPGDHNELMDEPNVEPLATRLQRCLR
jgi:thioesterase domain-containing protein